MAVLEIRESYKDRKCAITGQLERTAERTFFGITDDAFTSAMEVIDHPDVPRWGDRYVGPDDIRTNITVAEITVDQHPDDNKTWRIVVKYTSRLDTHPYQGTGDSGGKGGNPKEEPNPTARPPQINYSSVKRQRPLEKDTDGNPVVNSAGDPFDPPLTYEEVLTGMTITANWLFFDPNLISAFTNAVNSTGWWGAAAKTWRCADLGASLEYEQGLFFYKVTGKFEYKSDKWNPVKVLNIGHRALDPTNPDGYLRITDGQGGTLARGLLDADGFQLDAGLDPTYQEYTVYGSADFNTLFKLPGIP